MAMIVQISSGIGGPVECELAVGKFKGDSFIIEDKERYFREKYEYFMKTIEYKFPKSSDYRKAS